jgi:hypothetical protein
MLIVALGLATVSGCGGGGGGGGAATSSMPTDTFAGAVIPSDSGGPSNPGAPLVFNGVTFQGRCVPGCRTYYETHYGFTMNDLPSFAGVIEYWNSFNPAPPNMTQIPSSGANVPDVDDLLVLNAWTAPPYSMANRYGHVAIVVSVQGRRVTVVDSNWVGSESGGMHVLELDDPRVLGWFHPMAMPMAGTVEFDPAPSGDFGAVTGSDTRVFTLRNTSSFTVSGNRSIFRGSEFVILSGGGNYVLPAGMTQDVQVRVSSNSSGVKSSALRATVTGGLTIDLPLTADYTVAPPPPPPPAMISWGPASSIQLGQANPGQTRRFQFTLTNTGGTFGTGRIDLCGDAEFSLDFASRGSYGLNPGETKTVMIEFRADALAQLGTRATTLSATLNGGTAADLALSIDLIAGPPPPAPVQPAEVIFSNVPTLISFRPVPVGQVATGQVTLRNIVGLSGSGVIAISGGDFSILSGGGPYTLAAGASLTVTVQFAPSSVGMKSAMLSATLTGSVGGDTIGFQGEGT